MSFEQTSAALDQFMIDLVDGKPEASYSGGTVGDDFVLDKGLNYDTDLLFLICG